MNAITQLRPDVQVSVRLNEQVALNFFGTLREGRNVSALTSRQIGGGATFSEQIFLGQSGLSFRGQRSDRVAAFK
jgi:hypothetical protein